MTREKMDFDVIIVGAGPAGLSAAIRLAQLAEKNNSPLNICVIDKAASIGGQIISGAVFDPGALTELIPDWQQQHAPLDTPVSQDKFLFLSEKKSLRLPTPPQMHNHGNYIISLEKLCRWLAERAEQLGVNIFPGFAATEIIYENDCVRGIITGDKGVDRFGEPTPRFQPGMELYAKQTFFAEGARGSLTKNLIQKYDLRAHSDPQTYGLGIKEVWEIPSHLHQAGLVIHTIGWPLDNATYGGGFIYHLEENLMAIGFVVGLDYQNSYLNPYEEFQRLKSHPQIRPLLANSKRIAYGARTLNEGGLQSLPKLIFPGGLLIGCAAGFLNTPKIKGIHNAIKSGMVAAESVFPDLANSADKACEKYPENLRKTWLWKELHKARNIRPAMTWGLWAGLIYSAIDTYIFQGHAPWTFHNHADHDQLKPAILCKPMTYPKHDNQVTFDITTSLFLANISYVENQPYHLKLADRKIAIEVNYDIYASPEQRYCPAGVYEIIYNDNNMPRLQINGGNCIHCKACDIKDPTQNITWTPSEGGSGPQYEIM
jgi:electron-transferring-flavoprotein dehydrogenase